MFAYLLVLIAVISRVLPHPWMNFTAVGGSLLYFGAKSNGWGAKANGGGSYGQAAGAAGRGWFRWQMVLPVAALAATDYYLTVFAYNYPFHVSGYLVTWAWYAGVMLLGAGMLGQRASFLRVAGAVLGSATSFFLLSNFAVWAGSQLYAHSLAGLGVCYVAALPFYGNDLASTALVAGCAFGLPALARKIVAAMQDSGDAAAA